MCFPYSLLYVGFPLLWILTFYSIAMILQDTYFTYKDQKYKDLLLKDYEKYDIEFKEFLKNRNIDRDKWFIE